MAPRWSIAYVGVVRIGAFLFPWYEKVKIFHFISIFDRVENQLISGVIYISGRFDNLISFSLIYF